ncbi:hypothetical protein BCD67_21255 [Oscillatoriales cyanobacterium USR001]|nr:hypothetical protein BCD67_21255 [Oscillatoriales cyanobacterium USR001]
MSDLRATAEALLQVVQIHQGNFETLGRNFETLGRNFEILSAESQSLRRQQLESDQRFEILLAELRQLKIDSDRRFDEQRAKFEEQQAEIRKLLQHPFYQSQSDDVGDG